MGVTDSGWFADPGGKVNTFRWWDGNAWTRRLSADPTVPDPGPPPDIQPDPPSFPPPRPAAEPVAPADQALDLDALTPPNPADRVVRLPAAAAIVVTVVLLTVIGVGAIVSITADRPLTGPAVDPPPPTQAPAEIPYDPTTRNVSFEELMFIAPAAPFTCDRMPHEVRGTFTSAFTCQALVHRNYDKTNSSWTASVWPEGCRAGPAGLRPDGHRSLSAGTGFHGGRPPLPGKLTQPSPTAAIACPGDRC